MSKAERKILYGYAVIDGNIFGKTARYILLDQLFISLERRGQGIGQSLFKICCKAARNKRNKSYFNK